MDYLLQFNHQVFQCQDDVYTLAWYLMEDEMEAEALTQEAIRAAYDCFPSPQVDCHLLIMRHVVEQYRKRKRSARCSTQQGHFNGFHFTSENERLVVVLVDILGLDYAAAAFIAGYSSRKIGRLLAHARRKMKDQ